MVESWRNSGLALFLLVARLACSSAVSNELIFGYHERPVYLTEQPHKRDATLCPTSYSLCPASLSGGCCPTDRSCGISSCYLTTAPPTECLRSGYIACGIDQGGGCCPSGYTCANDGCLPPAGSSYSESCATGSYLCPSSVGYGCCHNDLACGVGYCYATSFSSVSLTLTITTTISNSITSTITTVVQTAYTEGIATAVASAAVTKFTPTITAVAKVEATSGPSSGGLSQAQLGGIIGAAVAVVLVVAISTFLILRRLNAVAKQQKAAAAKYSGSGSNKKSSSRPRPSPSAYENISIDPLMMSETGDTTTPGSVAVNRPSAVFSQRSLSDPASSPPIPAPYGSPHTYNGGYQPVPITELAYYDSTNHYRSRSDDSQGLSGSPRPSQTGYFDIDPALRDQNLRHGRDPRPNIQSHGRQWSDTSDLSQQSGGSDLIELDGTRHVERRNSLQRAFGSNFGFGTRRHSAERSRSSSINIRRDLGAAPGMSQRLENVQESPVDNKDKGKGVLGPSAGTHDKATNQAPDIVMPSVLTAGNDMARRERQKVLGNLDDLRLRDSG